MLGFKEGWQATLDRYQVNLIITQADSAFARMLAVNTEWRLVFKGPVEAVFAKAN